MELVLVAGAWTRRPSASCLQRLHHLHLCFAITIAVSGIASAAIPTAISTAVTTAITTTITAAFAASAIASAIAYAFAVSVIASAAILITISTAVTTTIDIAFTASKPSATIAAAAITSSSVASSTRYRWQAAEPSWYLLGGSTTAYDTGSSTLARIIAVSSPPAASERLICLRLLHGPADHSH